MSEIQKILCVIDPALIESPALQRAIWFATTVGAELEVLVVYDDDSNHSEALQDAALANHARSGAVNKLQSQIELLVERQSSESSVPLKVNAVWGGPVHEVVIRYARTNGADLVIKDACYDAALQMSLVSNQDWQLILCCRQPLWIVKRHELPVKKCFIAAVDPLHKNDKPAELDDAILRLGKSLAAATGDTLHAFHSFDPRIAMSAAENNVYIPVSLPLSDIEEQMREQHTLRFAQVIEPYGIPQKRQHLVTGLADEELPRLAIQLDATAVIMGAVSRDALKRMRIGSTAERAFNRLPSDLIVIKPDWFKSVVPKPAESRMPIVS